MSTCSLGSAARGWRKMGLGHGGIAALVLAGLLAGCGEGSGGSGGNGGGNGSLYFEQGAAVVTSATWGQTDAVLRVTHAVNLEGTLIPILLAHVDGIPCTRGVMNEQDHSVLELTCTLPPGNGSRRTPRLVIQQDSYPKPVLVQGGTLDVPLTECPAAATPAAGKPLPQLCRAEAGSTVETSNGLEGLWRGFQNNLLLVASDGTFAGGDAYYSFKGGKFLVTGESWTAAEGSTQAMVNSFSWYKGSGEFVPFDEVTSGGILADGYSPANALAVTASSVLGSWKNDDEQIAVTVTGSGSPGTVQGTTQNVGYGHCDLSGTIQLHEPGSHKNLFDLTLSATTTPGADVSDACRLGAKPLSGMAAIDVVNAGTQLNPVYAYELVFVVYQNDQAFFVAQLRQQ